MNLKVSKLIDETIDREGNDKYTNDPSDKGGETRYGITKQTARAYGYNGDMRTLPRNIAVEIYTERFWKAPGFAAIDSVFPRLAEAMFDWGVMSGSSRPIKAMQRELNVLNRGATDWEDIAADGVSGKMTLYALKAFIAKRGDDGAKVLFAGFKGHWQMFLTEICERDQTQEKYAYGWKKRAEDM